MATNIVNIVRLDLDTNLTKHALTLIKHKSKKKKLLN